MIKGLLLCLLFAVLAQCQFPDDDWVTTVNGVPQPPGVLIFDEEFDDLDLRTWQHEITLGGGGNWEFQYYMNNRTRSYTRDSVLYLKPGLLSDVFGEEFIWTGTLDINGGGPGDACTNPQFYGCFRIGTGDNYLNPTTSARIRSVNSFNFKYGKVEIKAQLPRGDWIWPAIWMLPTLQAYNGWPGSGEIDIMESRGNLDLSMNGVQIGTQQISQTLHFGPFFPVNGYESAHFEKNLAAGYDKAFHTYGIDWTPDSITFLIDDEEIGTVTPKSDTGFWGVHPGFSELGENVELPWQVEKGATKMAPFDQEFHFILNNAVGGTNGFFPDTATPGKPWANTSPVAFREFWAAKAQWYPTWEPEVDNGESAALKIDYIKVWSI